MILNILLLCLTAVAPFVCHAASFQEVTIQAEGAQLFCRAIGAGNPLIVIHGGPGMSQDYLLPQMAKLADTNFVIFYDQRSCGRSTGEITPESMQMNVFLDDIEAIRSHFGFKKVSILGHSWGGFIAMQYAIAHPESVDKLILSNSVPATSDGFSQFIKEWFHRTASIQNELAELHSLKAFQEGDPDCKQRYFRLMFHTYCFLPEKADLLQLGMAPQAYVNGEKVNEAMRQNVLMKVFDLRDSLKKLRMKTLVIHGDFDPVPAETAKTIHENIPGSQYVLMKNCGHFPYVEDPDVYFTVLNGFLH